MSRPTPVPDLDAEREVDLRSVWERIAARWWLPVLGTVLGLVAGFLLALGGGKVYEAETLIAMGQPFSPNGGAPVQSFLTNARAVSEIVRSESALEKAARRLGPARGSAPRQRHLADRRRLRTGRAADGSAARDDHRRRRPAAEGREGGRRAPGEKVITRTSAQYVDTKIEAFNDQLGSIQEQPQHACAADRAARGSGRGAGALVPRQARARQLARQRAGASRALLDLQSDVQQQLALAENVEKAQVVEPAAAVRTTARSGRNSALVGGLIGLLLGCAAALLADPFLARRARSA